MRNVKTLIKNPLSLLASLLLLGALLLAGGVVESAMATRAIVSYPRVAVLISSHLLAHASPSSDSRVVKKFDQFRSDNLPTALLALREKRDVRGKRWIEVSYPQRPNGRLAWVEAAYLDSKPVYKKIVIDISTRRLSLYEKNHLLFQTKVAVGTSSNPTPTGKFYVQSRFRPTNSFLGAFAFETSAYSPTLSEWPGGGLIGIHGTSLPSLLGKAVSHGCLRVSNRAASYLETKVPVGTQVIIHA
jgi:hypothetical protein